jgi:phenylacetate-coenzyme A ligase PaaK-like adenylate-forming protein
MRWEPPMRDAGIDPRLLRAMAEAARHIPLYRDLWSTSGLDGDLQGAPLLDKSALRAAPLEDRIHPARRERKLTAELSSGSSGEPLTTLSDGRAMWARRLAFLRALLQCGYRPWQKILLLTSRRRAKPLPFARWHYASIGDDTAHLARYAADVAPQVLYGPLSTLELLADHVGDHLPRLPSLRFLISTAEQLTMERQQSLERVFGVPVADFYGLSEFGLVAFRPPGAQAYLPARPTLVLEFLALAHDRAVEQLVVSDLAERTCPLIRYDTGDLVRRDRLSPDRPLVEFAGRAFDCILLPNGERISPYRIDLALEELPELRAFEVVQQPDFSIDVTIDVAKSQAEATRRAIAARLSAILGNATPFRISAGAIRRERSGAKFRPIRSLAGLRA